MKRTHTIFILVSIVLPVLVALMGMWWQWQWRAELPDPIATHWDGSGVPNGFGSLTSSMVMTGVAGMGVPVLIGGSALAGAKKAATPRGAFRLNAALAAGTGVFLTLLMTLSVGAQRGLADAQEMGGIGGVLGISFLVGIVVAVASIFLVPAGEVAAKTARSARPIPAKKSERLMWSCRVAMNMVVQVLLSVVFLGAGLLALYVARSEDNMGAALFLALAIVVGIGAVFSVSRFTVIINQQGIHVRSVLGWPSYRIALKDVVGARADTINAPAEFGGWGYRINPGKRGVVLRNGEALRVSQAHGPELVITLDHAEEAASVLMALAGRENLAEKGA